MDHSRYRHWVENEHSLRSRNNTLPAGNFNIQEIINDCSFLNCPGAKLGPKKKSLSRVFEERAPLLHLKTQPEREAQLGKY